MAAEVELTDIAGREYLLDAYAIRADLPEGANAVSFRLNGIVYTATEDPDDGYRSYMKGITCDGAGSIKGIFYPSCRVLAVMQTGDRSRILELRDVLTKKPVLEVGTDDSDDYYPSCIFAWYPENMYANSAEYRYALTKLDFSQRRIRVRAQPVLKSISKRIVRHRVRLTKKVR